MNRFEGRVAIVSGAARDIGAAVAKRLGAEGATVAVVDINEAGAHAVAEQIGGAAFAVGCDIGEPAAVAALHEAAIDRAAQAASAASDPAADLRGSVAYKKHMAGEMTRRALRTALQRAKGG